MKFRRQGFKFSWHPNDGSSKRLRYTGKLLPDYAMQDQRIFKQFYSFSKVYFKKSFDKVRVLLLQKIIPSLSYHDEYDNENKSAQ